MLTLKSWTGAVAATAAVCLLLAGCRATTSVRTHPDVATGSREIKRIVLVAPRIEAYEVTAGGVREPMAEWSATAAQNVTKALSSRFAGSGLAVTVIGEGDASSGELKEVLALIPAVVQSIRAHTYPVDNPDYFPQKAERFEYSLGSLDAILQPLGGDALLLVYGVDQFATSGKKALNVLGVITGVMASAVTGVAIFPKGEGTVLQMALADRKGNILWYNLKGGRTDLREAGSCSEFVDGTLEAFPGLAR